MKAQSAQKIIGVFWFNLRAVDLIEPVKKPGRQKPHGGTGTQYRHGVYFFRSQWPQILIARQKCAGLGDIEGGVGLEAPRIERNGQVIGIKIIAGKIKVNNTAILEKSLFVSSLTIEPIFSDSSDIRDYQVLIKHSLDAAVISNYIVTSIDRPLTITDELNDGEYFIEVIAQDSAGNQSIKTSPPFMFQSQSTFEVKDIVPYPNPVNPFTQSFTIKLSITAASKISYYIHDLYGRLVATQSNYYSAGTHQLVWNGQDPFGNPVQNGMYIGFLLVNERNGSGTFKKRIKIGVLK